MGSEDVIAKHERYANDVSQFDVIKSLNSGIDLEARKCNEPRPDYLGV